jgi:hypothetical protein
LEEVIEAGAVKFSKVSFRAAGRVQGARRRVIIKPRINESREGQSPLQGYHWIRKEKGRNVNRQPQKEEQSVSKRSVQEDSPAWQGDDDGAGKGLQSKDRADSHPIN